MGLDVLEYYSRSRIAGEIAGFLRNRWAALESGDRKWIRWIGDKPLTINQPEDVPLLFKRYRGLGVRSIYGTIEVFEKLSTRRDVFEDYEGNVVYATPFIDIDILDEKLVGEKWKYAVRIGSLIGDYLAGKGLGEALYYVWSGAGLHVRVNEKCFSRVLVKHHPVDVAFAVVEYTLDKLQPQILDVIRDSGYALKVENLVAMKRVFTAPLSLHRRLDRSAVPFTINELPGFSLEWTNPENPVYVEKAWSRGKPGQCDDFAEEALLHVGKVAKRTLLEVRATRIGPSVEKPAVAPATVRQGVGEPGRFPVMALLQAARYYVLKGDLEKAKSFGLNRAIFYAWAKYYGPAKRPVAARASRGRIYGSRVSGEVKRVEELGEKTQISSSGYYVMGGVEQRPEDFDRYVARRFEEVGIPFEEAWRKAIEYVKKFPRTILLDPQKFYKEVYEPVRDRFVEKVLRRKHEEKKTAGLDKWLGMGSNS